MAIYPGTFDPITNGHVDVIKSAAKLFDRVIVAVAKSSRKTPFISIEDRIALVKTVFKDDDKIEVLELEGLTVDFAKKHQANFICRGLRSASDFDYEFQLANMNRQLDSDIETVFLPSSELNAHISATIVREIVALKGDISKFVPADIVKYIKSKK